MVYAVFSVWPRIIFILEISFPSLQQSLFFFADLTWKYNWTIAEPLLVCHPRPGFLFDSCTPLMFDCHGSNLNRHYFAMGRRHRQRPANKSIILFKISQNPTLTDSPALKQSLFSYIPPTINFMLHNEMSAHQLHNDLRKHMKWKLSSITPAIVKRCARYYYFVKNKGMVQ